VRAHCARDAGLRDDVHRRQRRTGRDFTTICRSCGGAAGDLILVLDGSYSGFTLSKGTVKGGGVT
jgi:hypothetical protein